MVEDGGAKYIWNIEHWQTQVLTAHHWDYTSPTHLCYQQRPVGECLYLLHVERIEYSLVFCPSDELEGRMRLDMTVDDPTEVERQVLDGWGEHHPGRVCKLQK